MLLAGCGVPTGISVVGYVADGLSAGASGKTVNDHLVSQVMNMDCGLLRFLDGDWICRERGVDPEDDTIYMADGRTVDGPPRPWGTNAEPNLHYDDQTEHDARRWADGIELAEASIGDDPSGGLVTFDHDVDDGVSSPTRIGDMSETRDREKSYRAVAERIRFAQTLQVQYRQTDVPQTGPQTASFRPASAAAPAQPPGMIILDNLAFSESLGLDAGYSSRSQIMVAVLAELPPPTKTAAAQARDPETDVSAAPSYRVVGLAAHSANAFGFAAYGPYEMQADLPVIAAATTAPRRPAPAAAAEPDQITEVAAPATLPRLRDHGGRLAAADTYLVVGSFAARSNAVTAAALRQKAEVTVVESAVKGRTFYRLVAGPFEATKLAAARRTLNAAGYADSWTISICNTMSAGGQGCLTATQVASLSETDEVPTSIQMAGLSN